jgi:hemerythrin-like domain-containing protein
MNPIDIITSDHRKVEALFEEFEELGDTAFAHKRQIVDTIIKELEVHAEMEETLCYPKFQSKFAKEGDKLVEEAFAEHESAKIVLEELKSLDPEDAKFDAKVKVLKEQIEHHVAEEEGEILPKAQDEMSSEELETMAEEMMEFKGSRGVM